MKLEHGKYYTMSNGMAVGPVRRVYPEIEQPAEWAFYKDDAGDVYELVGLYASSPLSIVVSVIEERTFPEPPPPVPTDYSAFLAELAALTMKYGVSIAGCGCCGSPFLNQCAGSYGRYVTDKNGDNLEWRDD